MRIAIQRIGRLLALALAGWFAQACRPVTLDWRYFTYEAVTPQLANPLRDAKLSVSGQWSDRGPHFVVDGKIDANGHWACEQLPAVLTIEMQKPTSLQAARIWFYYGEPRVYAFFIETSPDGTNWTRVADWTKNDKPATAEGFIVPFKQPVEARHLRVTITDSSVRGAGGHIVEFQVFSASVSPGLRGRCATLERITTENAQGDESNTCWRATAWRNERVHGQFVVWSSDPIPQLRLSATALRNERGAEIPASAVVPRFVRYVLADKKPMGDILDTAERVDLPPGGFRPVWLTVSCPPALNRVSIAAFTVTGAGGRHLHSARIEGARCLSARPGGGLLFRLLVTSVGPLRAITASALLA